MNRVTRRITFSALFIALTVTFLYASAILPTGQLGFVAFASLFTVSAVIECGLASAVSVFIGGALLGFLILPNKSVVLLYALFLGYYPILKSLIEKIRKLPVEWVLKLLLFNAALSVVWFGFQRVFIDPSVIGSRLYLLYPAGNAVFVLYDIGLSKLIAFYLVRISAKLNKRNGRKL